MKRVHGHKCAVEFRCVLLMEISFGIIRLLSLNVRLGEMTK